MIRIGKHDSLPAALLLALLLIGAQSTALVHAYGHDPGTLQNQSCASCVTAGQLSHGCVDTPADFCPLARPTLRTAAGAAAFRSIHAFSARQRGPPVSR